MKELDEQEKLIVKELIKNPRISDNQISKISGVPLKTVNRKRKILENIGVISYYTNLEYGKSGMDKFKARQMYIVQLRHDITRNLFMEKVINLNNLPSIKQRHVLHSFLGEHDGHLTIVFFLESLLETDILDIFNADLVPFLKSHFGNDCIQQTKVINITCSINLFHHYYPDLNMERGFIKKDWPNDRIFID